MTLQRIELKVVREKVFSYDMDLPNGDGKVRRAADVYEMFKWLRDEIQENFYVLCLNVRGKAIGFYHVAKGSTNYVNVGIADIIRPALLTNAPRIILIHNHPSGDPTPSEEDKFLTEKVKEACDLFGITLNDHVVIGYEQYISIMANN